MDTAVEPKDVNGTGPKMQPGVFYPCTSSLIKKKSRISMRWDSVFFLRNVRLCKRMPLFLAQIATANYIAYQMWVFGGSVAKPLQGLVLFVVGSQWELGMCQGPLPRDCLE